MQEGSLVSWLPVQQWKQGNSPPAPLSSLCAQEWWRLESHWTFTFCGSDAVTWLHGETLSYPPLLPASRRVSAKVYLSSPLSSSAAYPASSSCPMGIMGSSSITSRGTDLLTYSRGNVALLFSSYEIIAPFSQWVNRGVVVRSPSTGKLTRTI